MGVREMPGAAAGAALAGLAAARGPIRPRGIALVVALVLLISGALAAPAAGSAPVLRIGSKRFTESTILGEILAQAAAPYAAVEHVPGMGNTAILFEALRTGAIDAYPEYLGTLERDILHHADAGATLAQLDAELAPLGLGVGIPLGFENRYALGVRRALAQALPLRSISDVAAHPQLRAGLSHEFLGRADGWTGLAQRYGLRNPAIGLDHGLAFEALAAQQVDLIDVYTTDAKIARFDIAVLDDDRGYFPRYDAVVLYRRALAGRYPAAWQAWQSLAGRISTTRMIALNGRAELDHQDADVVAREFLAEGVPAAGPAAATRFIDRLFGADFWRLGRQHLALVAVSVAAAALLGIPLGVLAVRARRAGAMVLATVSALQTIPALALLAALIPVLGTIGTAPALVALFIFALLPIVRNTMAGLQAVPLALREAAGALGARGPQVLWLVELPLAAPFIVAGVRTAAVISVGTATIGAFVGAGGFGERISIGLALNDGGMLLAGALPAAVLALGLDAGLGLLERRVRRRSGATA